MDKHFNEFLNDQGFAPAFDSTPVDAETLAHYKDKLPERLLDYWQEYGFCGFGKGLFWMTNPRDYHDIMETWLKQTPLWGKGNFYVVARDAFGTLYLRNDTSDASTIISPHHNTILPCDFPDTLPTKEEHNRSIGIFFAETDKDSANNYDENDRKLFHRCVKKLGRLAQDEMYTYVPALAFGGPKMLEHVQKAKIQEQLSLICSLSMPIMLKSTNELFGDILDDDL